jgi:hypothetical protein
MYYHIKCISSELNIENQYDVLHLNFGFVHREKQIENHFKSAVAIQF